MSQRMKVLGLVLFGCFASAHADVGAPVMVTLAGPPRPAILNESFEDTLLVISSQAGLLQDFEITGNSWGSLTWDSNPEFEVEVGVAVRIPISGTPLEGPYPLLVSYRLGTAEGHETLDLSPQAYATLMGPAPAVKLPDDVPPPALSKLGPDALTRPELPISILSATVDAAAIAALDAGVEGTAGKGPRNIRIRGRFVYTRFDNLVIGGDGVAVRAYHQKDFGDMQLFAIPTDANGYFDHTFFWNSSSDPDLYVVFELNNTAVHVKPAAWYDFLSGSPYAWRTSTTMDYTGNDFQMGTLSPGSLDIYNQTVHVNNNLVRAWRFLYNRGYNTPVVAARFPSEWWSQYGSKPIAGDVMLILNTHAWLDGTQIHEYGHHFVAKFATAVSPDYCNGICDVPSCGHCLWCRETDHDAFAEGFPNYLQDAIAGSFLGSYGVATTGLCSWAETLWMENIDDCSPGVYDDPQRTEGMMATVLRDIDDATQDAHGVFAGGMDELALGSDEILYVVDQDHPTTPMALLNSLKSRYPNLKEQLWATAKNSGYELDQFEPAAVTNLGSSTHMVGGLDSTNPKVTYTWTRASDDCSGIAGYSYFLTQYAPSLGPDGTIDVADVSSFTTSVLAPGNWWFSIRAIDRAGRVSTNWQSIGPVGIRTAIPANLVQSLPFGWESWGAPLIPRPQADGVPGPVIGDVYSYANNLVWNTGEVATGAITYTNLYVDGIFRQQYGILSLNSLQINTRYDQPILISGGRHTLGGFVDAFEVVAEQSELDNWYAQQWVWRPSPVGGGAPAERASPPSRYAGTEHIQGGPIYANCDALRFATNAGATGEWWTAAWVHCLDNTVDYDEYLYQPTSNLSNGFASPVAGSGWTAGSLDFVLVNNNLQPAQNWDVGVTDYTDVATGDYRLAVAGSSALYPNQTLNVNLAQDEMLKLWEVWVFGGDVGPLSMVADVGNAADGPVHLAWFDRNTTAAGRSESSALATSDPQTGRVRLDLNVSTAGYHCLVLFRDPTAGPNKAGLGPISVTLNVAPTPADYQPFLAFGWAAPLVPRDAADGSEFNVPAPLTLPGGGTTYLNFASINSGTFAGSSIEADVRLDGQQRVTFTMPINLGLGYATVNSSPQLTIAGGRHVLAMTVDPANLTAEIYETNNLYGEQWIWTPLAIAPGVAISRNAPPVLDGGWSEVTSGGPLYFNCDGLRTPAFSAATGGNFAAVAVMPGASSDVDVNLHELSAGAKSGFALALATSAWGIGGSDYVLANFHATPFRALDAGVTRWSGNENYAVEVVTSTELGAAKAEHGPFTLSAGHILQLHEVTLAAGFYNIRLENESGSVDWGITLHDGLVPYGNKLPLQLERIAENGDGGQGELLSIEITNPGVHCLAVWKAATGDLAFTGEYRLGFDSTVTAVEPTVPSPRVSALQSVHPNPFNPRTTVRFDVARAGMVRLAIFSLRGDLVRTLVAARLDAGSHDIVWDGSDELGRGVASGVYVVRLESTDVVDARKIVLIQ